MCTCSWKEYKEYTVFIIIIIIITIIIISIIIIIIIVISSLTIRSFSNFRVGFIFLTRALILNTSSFSGWVKTRYIISSMRNSNIKLLPQWQKKLRRMITRPQMHFSLKHKTPSIIVIIKWTHCCNFVISTKTYQKQRAFVSRVYNGIQSSGRIFISALFAE